MLLLAVCLIGGCRSQKAQPSTSTALVARPAGSIVHVVECWLKDPSDPEVRRKLIDAGNNFRTIPGVIDVASGSVVLPATDRAGGDLPDMTFIITFADAPSRLAYEENPMHIRARNDLLVPLTSRVQIYDFTFGK
jgi:hypothetical protein